jgi:hypothetical protein
VHASRYAMRYPHQPGALFRALSKRPWLSGVKGGFWILNQMVGQLGNKVTVQAVRPQALR